MRVDADRAPPPARVRVRLILAAQRLCTVPVEITVRVAALEHEDGPIGCVTSTLTVADANPKGGRREVERRRSSVEGVRRVPAVPGRPPCVG